MPVSAPFAWGIERVEDCFLRFGSSGGQDRLPSQKVNVSRAVAHCGWAHVLKRAYISSTKQRVSCVNEHVDCVVRAKLEPSVTKLSRHTGTNWSIQGG